MTTKHTDRQNAMLATTPGPWKVRNSVYVKNDVGRTVADCGMDDNDELPRYRGITNANNARLIAAAPDLLNMLQRMIDETSGGCAPCLCTMEHARAAISKVEWR